MSTSILVMKTHALGDVLLTTPSVYRLRQAFPRASLFYLTTERCAPLIKANPDVDTIVTIPDLRPGLRLLQNLYRLRLQKPELTVVFQSSRFARAAARVMGSRRIVYLDRNHKPGNLSSCPWPPPRDVYTGTAYQCLVDLVSPDAPTVSSIPRLFISPEDQRKGLALLNENGLKPDSYCVVAPGGGKNIREHVPLKLWAPDRFTSLIRRIQATYRVPVVVVGADSDILISDRIIKATPHRSVNFAGATSLPVLSTIIRYARFIVTHDSLPLHIAVALYTPVVGLFGPTSGLNFVPPESSNAIVVQSPVSCSPCYGNELFPGCKRDTPDCMNMIHVEDVIQAVERVLDMSTRAAEDTTQE